MRGGMEGVYDDMSTPTGMMHFAPLHEARGPLFGARGRLRRAGDPSLAAVTEAALYGNGQPEAATVSPGERS
jgi:hypothetical protein